MLEAEQAVARETGESSAGAAHTDLPSLMATVSTYESWFGPYNAVTLSVTATLGHALWCAGEWARAQRLMERTARDVDRYLGRSHVIRVRALRVLRDVLTTQGELDKAECVQRELVECQLERLGGEHPETLAAKADLAAMLMVSTNLKCDVR